MPDRRRTEPPSRPRRIILGFLLVSALAHATVLATLSPLKPAPGPSRPAVLEVVILAPERLPPEARDIIAAPRASGNSRAVPAPAADDRPRIEATTPVIALREPLADERQAAPAASELPKPSAAESPERESRHAAAAQTLPSNNAAYLSNPAPRYPDVARRSGEQGTVTLRVRVARDGIALEVAVEKSSGSPHLDAAALEAVKAWRFTPARRGAEAVESWMLVPIVFRLEG